MAMRARMFAATRRLAGFGLWAWREDTSNKVKGARRRRGDAHRVDWFKSGLRGVGEDCGCGWESGGGLTFPIGLGGVNSDEGLPVRHLRENEKKVLRLVELAGVLSDPTGWKFASGVFLRGFMRGCML
eukprot:scaffold2961_cov118-Isochrysis_galbana.AAC.7